MSFLGRFIPQNRDFSYHIPDFFCELCTRKNEKEVLVYINKSDNNKI